MEEKTRTCTRCQKPIKYGYVCDVCKKKRKLAYEKDYQKAYYHKRKDELNQMRKELAELRKFKEQYEGNHAD